MPRRTKVKLKCHYPQGFFARPENKLKDWTSDYSGHDWTEVADKKFPEMKIIKCYICKIKYCKA